MDKSLDDRIEAIVDTTRLHDIAELHKVLADVREMQASHLELVYAMRKYQSDCDGDAPWEHINMMARASIVMTKTGAIKGDV